MMQPRPDQAPVRDEPLDPLSGNAFGVLPAPWVRLAEELREAHDELARAAAAGLSLGERARLAAELGRAAGGADHAADRAERHVRRVRELLRGWMPEPSPRAADRLE
jgi:hypothetical protein